MGASSLSLTLSARLRSNRINVNEIESVTVSRTLLGRRLTFCYGYGKKAVAYPADLNDVTAYLKRYRIAVDYDDKKQ